MGKRKSSIPNYNPHPPVAKKVDAPPITSFLDQMEDGKEYVSIVGLNNVNVDLGKELSRAIKEIVDIRKRPSVCYISNVINTNITQSISLDRSDDTPFLEMIRNVPSDQKDIDIILVTPGGSAETADFLVKQLRSRFDNVAFILPYMAMSAGTIFCMSGDELIMDESAFFGPIDPQVPSKNGRYVPAQLINTLIADIQHRGQEKLLRGEQPDWTDVQILRNLDAKEIGNAINASKLSSDLVSKYLKNYKFKNWNRHSDGTLVTLDDKEKRASEIANQLCDHSLWLSHSSRITRDMALDVCHLQVTHPEDIPGLYRAIKRFWALVSLMLEQTMISKIFASENYMLFRSETPKK